MAAPRLSVLVERALNGDKGALRLLARRALPLINARARQHARRRGGADDFEIDTMVQLLWTRCLADLRSRDLQQTGATLPGLILEVCDAHMEDALGNAPAPAPEPPSDPALAPLWTHLCAVLPPRALLAFRLMYTDDRSPRTVARLLAVDEAQVEQWQTQIRTAAAQWSAARGESA